MKKAYCYVGRANGWGIWVFEVLMLFLSLSCVKNSPTHMLGLTLLVVVMNGNSLAIHGSFHGKANQLLTYSLPISRKALWQAREGILGVEYSLAILWVLGTDYQLPGLAESELFLLAAGWYAGANVLRREAWCLFAGIFGLGYYLIHLLAWINKTEEYNRLLTGESQLQLLDVICLAAMFLMTLLNWRKEKKIFVKGAL